MRYHLIIASFVISARLFGDEVEVQSMLEKHRQPPLRQNLTEGTIIRKDSSFEWQGKMGNTNVKIGVDHIDPASQWKEEWENRCSKLRAGEDPDKEKKSFSPSIHFSLSWSSDD